jgi:signal transduction histidine kinase
MKKNKIVMKMGGSILIYFFLLLVPLSYSFYQLFVNFFVNYETTNIENTGYGYSFLLSQSMDKNDFLNQCENLSEINNLGLRVLDKKGDFIYSSQIPYSLSFTKEEVDQILHGKTITRVKYNGAFSLGYIIIGIPMRGSLINGGAIILYDDLSFFHETQNDFKNVTIYSIIGSILLAVGITFLLSRRLGKPLIEIIQAIRDISKNNYKKKKKIRGNDEISYILNALNELSDELHRYNSSKNALLANISHEIRTPLTYIQGYSIALQQDLYQDEKEMKGYLKIIENETHHILRMVNDLMDVARIENGQLSLRKEICDLRNIISEIVEKVLPRVNEKNIQLEKSNSRFPFYVNVDPLRIKQVLFNIIDNSLRYTPDKGKINIDCSENYHEFLIKINDNGIGISEEELPLIWERFYRSEKSRDKALGGVGLGLPIVKQFVELHGGRIEVLSKLGQGTTFSIYLPKIEEI